MQLFLYSPLGKAALSAPSCEAARLRHIGECCWQAVHACADWQAHLSREPLNAKLPLLAAAPIKRATRTRPAPYVCTTRVTAVPPPLLKGLNARGPEKGNIYNMSWGKGEARGAPPLMPDTLIHTWGTATFEPPKWLFPTMFTPNLTQPNP